MTNAIFCGIITTTEYEVRVRFLVKAFNREERFLLRYPRNRKDAQTRFHCASGKETGRIFPKRRKPGDLPFLLDRRTFADGRKDGVTSLDIGEQFRYIFSESKFRFRIFILGAFFV